MNIDIRFDNITGNNFGGSISIDGFDYQKSYTVQVQMSDSLNTITKTQDIAVGRPSPWWDEENLYVDGHYYKRDSNGTMRRNSTLLDAIEIPTGHNLEDYKNQPGFYYGYDASQYSRVPVANGAFTLNVSKSGDGVVRQVFTKYRENATNTQILSWATFERYYTNKWSRWTCSDGYIEAYNSNGSSGWYKILTVPNTSGYGEVNGTLLITCEAGYTPQTATINFGSYNGTTVRFRYLNGAFSRYYLKAIQNEDKTIDIYVKSYTIYQPICIKILHLTIVCSSPLDIHPVYIGSSLPTTGTQYEFTNINECGGRSVILYDNADGNREKVSLSSSITLFRYLEIYFADNNLRSGGYTKIVPTIGKKIGLSIIEASSTTSTYIRRTDYTVNEFDLTPDTSDYGYAVLGTNTVSHASNNNYIKIQRVVGYE